MPESGRCLCGALRYEIATAPAVMVNCHCQYCRRVSGAAFVTVGVVSRSDFRWLAEPRSLRGYETPGGTRYFCGDCGTRIYASPPDDPELLSLAIPTLDREPEGGPALHVNLESKAPWYEIRDELPGFPGLPPQPPPKPETEE